MEQQLKYTMQECQDDDITLAFRKLHDKLVNDVIQFCIEHDITIDEFHLNADCLEDSIKAGSWQPCTDSCLSFDKFSDEWKDIITMKKIVSDKEYKLLKLQQKPYLFSM